MNFNKCNRCGCFFVVEGDTCPNCLQKDHEDINKLENFITENDSININFENIISQTGISEKNLNRFLSQKQFSNLANQLKSNL